MYVVIIYFWFLIVSWVGMVVFCVAYICVLDICVGIRGSYEGVSFMFFWVFFSCSCWAFAVFVCSMFVVCLFSLLFLVVFLLCGGCMLGWKFRV